MTKLRLPRGSRPYRPERSESTLVFTSFKSSGTADGSRVAQTLESEISALEEKRDLLILTKQQDEVEKRESVKARTLVELKIRDLEETSERNAGQRQELQTSIEDLEGEISKKEAELAAVQPRFEQAQQKEADAQRLLEQAEAKQKSLFDKQARVSQYRTQKERDAFLMQQIRDSKAHLQAREKNLEDIDRNINNASSTIDQNKKKQDDVKRRHEEGKASIVEQQKQLDRLSADLAAKQEKRKEIWKEDEKLSSTIAHAKQEQSTAQKTLYGTMDGVRTIPVGTPKKELLTTLSNRAGHTAGAGSRAQHC